MTSVNNYYQITTACFELLYASTGLLLFFCSIFNLSSSLLNPWQDSDLFLNKMLNLCVEGEKSLKGVLCKAVEGAWEVCLGAED